MRLTLLICLIPALAAAEETTVSPVVVSATRIATPADQVASSVTLITAADLQSHQWRTAADALAQAPGLNITQTGGPGGLTSVFIRGANSNHTKVIIDGIEVNDPSQGGAFEFGQMVTSDLQSVEVLRGPQSGLYGADALGGVITMTTKTGEGPTRLTGASEAGAFATFNQTAGLAGASGALHYAVTLAHHRTGATPVTPLDLLPPGRARLDDFYDNITASTKLAWDPSVGFGLDLTARYTDGHLRTTSDDFSVVPSVPVP